MQPRGPLLIVVALAVLAAGCTDRAPSGDVSTAGPFVPSPGEPTVLPDQSGPPLLAALRAEYAPTRTLGYNRARDALFTYEMETDGVLEGIYTGFAVTLPPGRDPSATAAGLGINTEHVWPQSFGARAEPFKSDLHHLFPARDVVNTSRGNLPLGEIPDRQAEAWYRADLSQSAMPRADLDAWSERGAGRFEPRENRAGDVARAALYAYTLYRDAADAAGGAAFFEAMRADLLDWNDQDPPDAAEVARSAWIAEQQGAENPYVLDPTLARRAFGAGVVGPVPPPAPAPTADLSITEIHYDNEGADVGEGVEVSGPVGTALDGWAVAFYNGTDGAVYRTVPLGGRVPASGARWVPVEGVQNGGPDGLALVAPDGTVREFLSYEGTFPATSGPAAGRRSSDLGVSESSGTPVGQSLQRSARGWSLRPATPGRPTG